MRLDEANFNPEKGLSVNIEEGLSVNGIIDCEICDSLFTVPAVTAVTVTGN